MAISKVLAVLLDYSENCLAVFMLYVAFRCYQQSSIRDDWVEDEAGGEETS